MAEEEPCAPGPQPSAPRLSEWALACDEPINVAAEASSAPAQPAAASTSTPLLYQAASSSTGAAKDAPPLDDALPSSRPGAPPGGWPARAPAPADAPAATAPPPEAWLHASAVAAAAAATGPPQLVPAPLSATCVLRLLLSVVMWSLVLAVLFSYVEEDYVSAVGISAAVAYAIYVLMYLFSGASRALCNMGGAADLQAYISALRGARTALTSWIKCYHYETRTRQVSYTDDKGHRRWRTETYTETVYTHSAEEDWRHGSVRDTSGPAPFYPHVPLVQVRIQKVLDFHDARARAMFDAWQGDFFARNNRDVHHTKGMHVKIDGFSREHVMMMSDAASTGRAPLLANSVLHTLLVLLGVAAVYELCVLRKIPRARWLLVKTVTV